MTATAASSPATTHGGDCRDDAGSIKAATAASVFTFPTPRKDNRRRRAGEHDRRRRHPGGVGARKKEKDIQREYRLLQSQTFLLLGTAAVSFLLFLLFTLPFAALVGLTVMTSSLGACLLLLSAAVRTRYQLELEHPLGLVRYLPQSLRAHLTEKSLHECLSPIGGSSQSLASLSSAGSKGNSSSRESLSTMSLPSQHNNIVSKRARSRL